VGAVSTPELDGDAFLQMQQRLPSCRTSAEGHYELAVEEPVNRAAAQFDEADLAV
jgi:hypothetical protein